MQGGGVSSQAIWTAFNNVTTAFTRTLKWALNIAWNRIEDTNAGFAIVGTSVVSGTDLIKGEGISAVTNSDIFSYYDETDRVIDIEYDRTLQEPLGGISTAILNTTLDNSDSRFTPDYNSTIGTALLPKRPINAHIGFEVQGQNKKITVFKGLTKMPHEDKTRRQLKLTAVDYVEYLSNIPMESAKYVDQRSDQIIASILSDLGFGTSQYELDTGLNTIGFAYFRKGVSAGHRIKKICEAEEAAFYQDENGILRFENRRHFSASPHNTSVWDIKPEDIISWDILDNTRLINKVVVKAKPRTVRTTTQLWQHPEVISIAGSGGTTTVWAEFRDPVNDVLTPAENTDYEANTAEDGSGSDISADIDITMTEFTTAAKLVITNNNASTAYMVDGSGNPFIKLRGDPATYIDDSQDPPVSNEILEEYSDADSVNKFDEQLLTIENDFITDSSYAQTLAQHIVNKYKDPNKRIKLTVQGIPQLQLRDQVKVYDRNLYQYL